LYVNNLLSGLSERQIEQLLPTCQAVFVNRGLAWDYYADKQVRWRVTLGIAIAVLHDHQERLNGTEENNSGNMLAVGSHGL
jgi:hypothetical protein